MACSRLMRLCFIVGVSCLALAVRPAVSKSASDTVAYSDAPKAKYVSNGLGKHSLAVLEDGTVLSWGGDYFGQLGDGTTVEFRSMPIKVPSLIDVSDVSTGVGHSMALKTDGTVWCWGWNSSSQLGDGGVTDRITPIKVSSLGNVISIASGATHSMALKSDGTVWCWGKNRSGQLGVGNTYTNRAVVQAKGLIGVIAISAGGDASMALKNDGTVWTWGMGSGTAPARVAGLSDVKAVATWGNWEGEPIYVELPQFFALKNDGTVWGWGNGQALSQVAGLTGVEAISASGPHVFAVKNDHTVWAWGSNILGQIGNGVPKSIPSPVQVEELAGMSRFGGGQYHSLALTADGGIRAFGDNRTGQIGDGTTTGRYVPAQVGVQNTCETTVVGTEPATGPDSIFMDFSAGGGTGIVDVTSPAGCPWTATVTLPGEDTWLRVTSGASGVGNGTVRYVVDPNAEIGMTGSRRRAYLAVAGHPLIVDQDYPCRAVLTPSQVNVAGSGHGSFTVSADAGCNWSPAWKAYSDFPWIRVTAGETGVGHGTVEYAYDANPLGTARNGSIRVSNPEGTSFTDFAIKQPSVCQFSIIPQNASGIINGGTGTIDVSGFSGSTACSWEAVSDSDWLRVTSGSAGSGQGAVSYLYDLNSAEGPRTGHIAIGGLVFTLVQEGLCNYLLQTQSANVSSLSGAGAVSLSATTGCAWTAASNDTAWLTVVSGSSGAGNGQIGYAFSANPSPSPRTGTLTIAGLTYAVTQAGLCQSSLDTSSRTVSSPAGNGTIALSMSPGCAWEAISSASWLTITSTGSGQGNGAIAYAYTENTAQSSRTATISVAGKTFTLTQQGACRFTLNPASVTLGKLAATGCFTVNTAAQCTWTASEEETWISLTSGFSGSGNGTTCYAVTENTSPGSRNGGVSIGGGTFAIRQSGTCGYAISASSVSTTASAGSGCVNVVADTICDWVTQSNASWISIVSGNSGMGNGKVCFSYLGNTSHAYRTGTMTIAGLTYIVYQDGAALALGAPSVFQLLLGEDHKTRAMDVLSPPIQGNERDAR